jgi:hypothetical protein
LIAPAFPVFEFTDPLMVAGLGLRWRTLLSVVEVGLPTLGGRAGKALLILAL